MAQQAYVTETADDGPGPGRRQSRLRRLLHRITRGWRGDRRIWRRGIVLAALAVVLSLVLGLHAHIPNRIGNLGSLTETFLPWFGLLIPVLLVLALVRRSATALIALVLPVAASGADVLALEELKPSAVPAYERALRSTYTYHSVQGTVGLWSKYPLGGVRAVDIRLGWTRAMRATVDTPEGPVAVYVAHMPSVRVRADAGFTAAQRDQSADALGEAIADERLPRVILLGDLNGTMNDRSLNAVTAQMRSTQGAAGDGFGFSWPAAFPMARIDQIMVRGVEPVSSWTLPRTDSDHLPVAARVNVTTSATGS